MDKNCLYYLLSRLNEYLKDYDSYVDIYIYGGACLALAYDMRTSTNDIDAIYGSKLLVNKLVGRISEEEGIPNDWLNDAVKGFVPTGFEYNVYNEFSNLRIHFPTKECMFAMKCLAARLDTGSDLNDIMLLGEDLNIASPSDAMDIVTKYYPIGRIQNKTYYLLEELYGGD